MYKRLKQNRGQLPISVPSLYRRPPHYAKRTQFAPTITRPTTQLRETNPIRARPVVVEGTSRPAATNKLFGLGNVVFALADPDVLPWGLVDCFSEGLVVLFEDVFCRFSGCFCQVHYYCGFYVAFGLGQQGIWFFC